MKMKIFILHLMCIFVNKSNKIIKFDKDGEYIIDKNFKNKHHSKNYFLSDLMTNDLSKRF